MFKPLTLYIGLRYTRAKRSSSFISFIALTSVIGIALGVMVLITVLSVMNGFDAEIHKRFFGMAPEITISQLQDPIENWQPISEYLKKFPEIRSFATYVGGQGLLSQSNFTQPAYISGIDPIQEQQVSKLKDSFVQGKLENLKPGEFGILIGRELADRLGVKMGDKITVLIPQGTVSPSGFDPRLKRFTLVGIFSVGVGFGFDDRLAFIHIQDAQSLFMISNAISGFHIRINEIYAAPYIAAKIASDLPNTMYVSNWTSQFGAFFKAVKMEKTMMFLILMLIIAVAAFNLVSSLVMIVNDKQSEIAILRTYGALPSTILGIFMVQGFVIGLFGTTLGIISGVTLALNVTSLTDWLQKEIGSKLISQNLYFLDHLPSLLDWHDVIKIAAIALFLSFLATLYPALHASRTQPAQALRYE